VLGSCSGSVLSARMLELRVILYENVRVGYDRVLES